MPRVPWPVVRNLCWLPIRAQLGRVSLSTRPDETVEIYLQRGGAVAVPAAQMLQRAADDGESFGFKPEGIAQKRRDLALVAAHWRMFAVFVEGDVGPGFERHFHRRRAGFGHREEHDILLRADKHQSCQSP